MKSKKLTKLSQKFKVSIRRQKNQNYLVLKVYQIYHLHLLYLMMNKDNRSLKLKMIGNLSLKETFQVKQNITLNRSSNMPSLFSIKKKNKRKLTILICIKEVHQQLKIFNLKFVIQVMDAGHIIISHQKFKLVNIVHPKLCSVLTMM